MGKSKPLVSVGEPEPEEKALYYLNYIKGSAQMFRLLRFNFSDGEPGGMGEIVKAAKAYCTKNNYRFVFIEPAITDIVVDRGTEDYVID